MTRLSLRTRLTLLTGLILLCCSLVLTITSINNARTGFEGLPFMSYTSNSEEALPEEASNAIKAVEVTPSQAVQEADDLFTRQTLLVLGLVIIAGMGAVYFITGRTVKPLQNLSQKIDEISSKNLSTRLPENESYDEVGHLTHGFNQMLERLDESFNQQKRFATSAAHELKTPLATIKVGLQVLQMEKNPSPKDYEETLEVTEKSIERMIHVVEDLLLLTSTEEKRPRETIVLQTMMETIVSELTPMYEGKKVCVAIQCGDCTVNGNSALLFRAFSNLIENGLKYNHQGGTLAVSAVCTKDHTTVKIADTGPGIPEAHLEKIFEPFYRMDTSRSRKIAGSGLGLSLAKSIFEQQKAGISLESEVGKGTLFTIEF